MKDDKKGYHYNDNNNKILDVYSNQNKKGNKVELNFKDNERERNFVINPQSVNNNNDKKSNRHHILEEMDAKSGKIEKKNSERKYFKEPEKKDSDKDMRGDKEDFISKFEKK